MLTNDKFDAIWQELYLEAIDLDDDEGPSAEELALAQRKKMAAQPLTPEEIARRKAAVMAKFGMSATPAPAPAPAPDLSNVAKETDAKLSNILNKEEPAESDDDILADDEVISDDELEKGIYGDLAKSDTPDTDNKDRVDQLKREIEEHEKYLLRLDKQKHELTNTLDILDPEDRNESDIEQLNDIDTEIEDIEQQMKTKKAELQKIISHKQAIAGRSRFAVEANRIESSQKSIALTVEEEQILCLKYLELYKKSNKTQTEVDMMDQIKNYVVIGNFSTLYSQAKMLFRHITKDGASYSNNDLINVIMQILFMRFKDDKIFARFVPNSGNRFSTFIITYLQKGTTIIPEIMKEYKQITTNSKSEAHKLEFNELDAMLDDGNKNDSAEYEINKMDNDDASDTQGVDFEDTKDDVVEQDVIDDHRTDMLDDLKEEMTQFEFSIAAMHLGINPNGNSVSLSDKMSIADIAKKLRTVSINDTNFSADTLDLIENFDDSPAYERVLAARVINFNDYPELLKDIVADIIRRFNEVVGANKLHTKNNVFVQPKMSKAEMARRQRAAIEKYASKPLKEFVNPEAFVRGYTTLISESDKNILKSLLDGKSQVDATKSVHVLTNIMESYSNICTLEVFMQLLRKHI